MRLWVNKEPDSVHWALAIALIFALAGMVRMVVSLPTSAPKDSYDDVPPITGFMQRQIDRGMLRDVWTYVQDQKAYRAQYLADLKNGKIPHLPGVK